MSGMLEAIWKPDDKKAKWLIIIFSIIVFSAITMLSRVQVRADLGFDIHIFARANAIINSCVSLLLIIALVAVKQKKFVFHRNVMLTAMLLSVLFLVSYILHHLFTGETRYGDANQDGIVSEIEKAATGNSRIIYYIILGTHIPLAGLILPFILFTAYRGLTGQYEKHKRLARITWPVWFYVAVSGVVVYLMISPYY